MKLKSLNQIILLVLSCTLVPCVSKKEDSTMTNYIIWKEHIIDDFQLSGNAISGRWFGNGGFGQRRF